MTSQIGIIIVLLTVIPAVTFSIHMSQPQPVDYNSAGHIISVTTNGYSIMVEQWTPPDDKLVITGTQSDVQSGFDLVLNYTDSHTNFIYTETNVYTKHMMQQVEQKYPQFTIHYSKPKIGLLT